MIYRLVFAGMATYTEIVTSWSLDDVLKANAVLNYKEAIDNELTKKK